MGKKTLNITLRLPSRLESEFAHQWKVLGYEYPLVREHRFHQKRRWRFDFAHLLSSTAIELEGGIHQMGRHQRPLGFQNDCIKYFTAQTLGWQVIRLTHPMIQPDNLDQIAGIIAMRLRWMNRD